VGIAHSYLLGSWKMDYGCVKNFLLGGHTRKADAILS